MEESVEIHDEGWYHNELVKCETKMRTSRDF
jgi:hypothetical protein